MVITDEQVAAYERDGAVVIDGPFIDKPDDLDRCEAGWDRLHDSVGVRPTGQPAWEDPAFVECVGHPFFEKVAKRVLRADSVGLFWGFGSSLHSRPPSQPPFPSPTEQWANGCHTDIQATLADFQAVPRRARCELWHWVNDVPAHRGAMRVLLGSHRVILSHWDVTLTAEHKRMLPRVHGLSPNPRHGHASYPEQIAPPMEGGEPWEKRRPAAMTARRGQILVLCSSALHSAWQNEDSVPRKAFGGGAWIPTGVRGGLPKDQFDARAVFLPALRNRLPADRRHIALPQGQFFISDYAPQWPETFADDYAVAKL